MNGPLKWYSKKNESIKLHLKQRCIFCGLNKRRQKPMEWSRMWPHGLWSPAIAPVKRGVLSETDLMADCTHGSLFLTHTWKMKNLWWRKYSRKNFHWIDYFKLGLKMSSKCCICSQWRNTLVYVSWFQTIRTL